MSLTAIVDGIDAGDRIRVALYLVHAAELDQLGDDVPTRERVLGELLGALGVPATLTTPMPNNPPIGRRTSRDELADWLLDLADSLEEIEAGKLDDQPRRFVDAREESLTGHLDRLIRIAAEATP